MNCLLGRPAAPSGAGCPTQRVATASTSYAQIGRCGRLALRGGPQAQSCSRQANARQSLEHQRSWGTRGVLPGGRKPARVRSTGDHADGVVAVVEAEAEAGEAASVDAAEGVSVGGEQLQQPLTGVEVVVVESSVQLDPTIPGDGDGDAPPSPAPASPTASPTASADQLEAAVMAARTAAPPPAPTLDTTESSAPAPAPPAGPAAPAPAAQAARRKAPRVELPLHLLAPPAPGTPGAPDRTVPPALDLPRVAEAVLGDHPSIGPVFSALFDLAALNVNPDTGLPAPLLYAPGVPRPPGSPPADTLPLLVYLPGIDGTGLAAYRQFVGLSGRFDFRALFLPPEDRTPFTALVDVVAHMIEEEVADMAPSRPVYLLGESFGGLLGLALAQRLSCVDRLVLINPATSFDSSPWPALGPLLPSLPAEAYRLLPIALAPVLSNPLAMVRRAVGPGEPLPVQLADLMHGLLDLLPELSALRVVLPPATLAWRLQLLKEGAAAVNPTLAKVKPRTLLLAGQNDFVIPSAAEARRLPAAMPRCRARVLPGRSHALLQEEGVDLVRLLQEEDFYVSQRVLTRSNVPSSSSSSSARRRLPPGGANFGTSGPVELPTPGELRRAKDDAGLTNLKRLVSPVYLSTHAATGRVQLGLGGLPPYRRPAPGEPPARPVLFVGNHQTFAPDMPLMVEHFIEERGQLLRGLAHPMALGMGPQPNMGLGGMGGEASQPGGARNDRFGRFLETFGAVPVSGRNLHALLAAGESALLYPGGVREALKLRHERYQLVWPRRSEFVRMAARHGATIVPFAAVGAEDSLELLADRRDLLEAPLLGQWLKQQEARSVAARRGVSQSEDIEESFIPPLIAPKPPARFYFVFAAPIATTPDMAADRSACDALYRRVKGEVEWGLGYLLRKREQDPFKDLVPRLLYEASWGGKRQAPTFTP